MLLSSEDAQAHLKTGQSLLGPGWREVESFEDLTDEDEYTTDEEELYAVLDFGQAIDRQQMQSESTYQLIGLDTPLPFIKLGNQVYQGEMSPLIGDEVILGMVRDPANPTKPSHVPLHTASRHLLFRPIVLKSQSEAEANAPPATSDAATPGGPIPEEATFALPKPRGRPKGATSRPRIVVRSEEDVRNMDIGSLPDNIIIDIEPLAVPGEPLATSTRLTKLQAERIVLGLTARNRIKRSHDTPGPSNPVLISQAGRRARERAAAAAGVGGEGDDGEEADMEGNAEAGPSEDVIVSRTRDGAPRAPSKAKGKGKGKGKGKEKAQDKDMEVIVPAPGAEPDDEPEVAGIEHGENEHAGVDADADQEDEEGADRAPDVQLGGLTLTSHDPLNPKPRKKYKPPKMSYAGDSLPLGAAPNRAVLEADGITGKIKRKRRTRAEMDAARAVEAEARERLAGVEGAGAAAAGSAGSVWPADAAGGGSGREGAGTAGKEGEAEVDMQDEGDIAPGSPLMDITEE